MPLQNEMPSGDADTRVLRPTPSGFDYAVILGGFAVAIYGLWRLVPPSPLPYIGLGLGCILGPGGFAAFTLIRLVIARPELRLDREGFSFISFGKARHYAWTDLDKPVASTGTYKNRATQFSLREPETIAGKLDKKLTGYSNRVPDIFLREGRLVSVMNVYWSSAVQGLPLDFDLVDRT